MSIANDPSAILAAALSLPLAQRKEIAEELFLSVEREEPKDPDYDRLWAEEPDRRWQAIERGEMELIDSEDVMKRLRHTVENVTRTH